MRHLSADDFDFLARLLHRRSGLVLTPKRPACSTAACSRCCTASASRTIAQLVRELRLGNDSVAAALTEAITVNDTSFFRDPAQFDALQDRAAGTAGGAPGQQAPAHLVGGLRHRTGSLFHRHAAGRDGTWPPRAGRSI